MQKKNFDYDYVVIGSGFGGSVAALRLSEKGYKVLVIEKGKWFSKESDFPKTNWNLKKWMWLPSMKFSGLFKMTVFRHVAVLSGVGVGGGSLVYANTLPVPNTPFFKTGTWSNLCNWEEELKPFFSVAKQMLGAAEHPYMSRSDKVMQQLAAELGNEQAFEKTDAAVYFGKPGETVNDPYFNGKGPTRTGCTLCGGCMLGCRFNAKNTLDKNYLYLAQQLGAEIIAEQEVYDVIPLSPDGSDGYEIHFKDSLSWFPSKKTVTAKAVVFAGGVLGTLKLLLKLQSTSLPNLSRKLGSGVRTNSESLIGITTYDKTVSFSDGIAIGSIVKIDENRHVEPVKYPAGSGFWRLLMAPMVSGSTILARIGAMVKDWVKYPVKNIRTYFVNDWSSRTHILLYMESIDSTLQMARSKYGRIKTLLEKGTAPTAFNSIAQDIARKTEKIADGKATVMLHETLFGIPSTAHILGGACMGKDETEGVIDASNRVFNYSNMLICDGSVISANIGVNPSLTITAIAERAMSKVQEKNNL
ncbi:MAG: GMC oxidoreductase [Lacibacter sp.]